ncbi:uncharacterized protein LOC135391118 [Ornithodoros turicata]|uniref:uncharacterized protein LOC135391118 n=1 Tax=Ornithodoros turicata TaxID=34597 RepID=UPI0031390A7B
MADSDKPQPTAPACDETQPVNIGTKSPRGTKRRSISPRATPPIGHRSPDRRPGNEATEQISVRTTRSLSSPRAMQVAPFRMRGRSAADDMVHYYPSMQELFLQQATRESPAALHSPRSYPRTPRGSIDIGSLQKGEVRNSKEDHSTKPARLFRVPEERTLAPLSEDNEDLSTDLRISPPLPSSLQTSTKIEGDRRKSSVRFGQATYREIENESYDNISPLPSRYTTAVTAFMIVCMCIILFMLYVLTPPPKSKRITLCATKACLDAMTYLENSVDQRVNPCIDFYGHVCSSWTSRTADTGFIRDAQLQFRMKINRTLLEEDNIVPDRHGGHILRYFYKDCHKFMTSQSHPEEPPYQTFRKQFGSLRGFLARTYPSVLVGLIRISLAHGIDSVFGVRLIDDMDYPKLMIYHTRSVRKKLSEDNFQRTDGYLLEFLQNVSESLFPVKSYHQKVLSLDDDVNAVLGGDEPVLEVMSQDIEHLMTHVTPDMLYETANSILPLEYALHHDSKIKIRGFNATRQVITLLDHKLYVDNKLPIIYLYVQLAADVIRLDYHRLFSESAHDVIHICLVESQKILSRTWPYLYASMSEVVSHDSTIETLYTRVVDEIINVDYLNWMDGKTQLLAMRAMTNITIGVFPAAAEMVSLTKTSYTDVVLPNKGFILNYLHLLSNEQLVRHKFPPQADQDHLNQLQLDGPILYVKSLRSIIIPSVYRLPPIYYSTSVPEYFDLATVGALLAKELSEVLGPIEGSTWWSEPTKVSFNRSFQCLMNMHERMTAPGTADEADVTNEIFAWTRSARLAYDLMKSQIVTSKDSLADARRVFFQRFCLMSCSSRQEGQPLTPRQQCMLPLLNMPEFAETFQCPLGGNARLCKIL